MSAKKKQKSAMRELFFFIPNLVRLLVQLLRDPRVSSADKAIVAGTIIYVIAPIDVIPDFIPFIGQVDDAYLIAISILRLLARAERRVVTELWKGQIDITQLVTRIASVSEYFLPGPVKKVLRGKIDPKSKLAIVTDKQANAVNQ